jgi:signal transduction histidine kinase
MPTSTTFLSLLLTVLTAGSLLVSLLLQAQWPDWRFHHAPLHSAMETVGGLASIGMAAVLLLRRDDPADNRLQPAAVGFLAMGILEVFHAVAEPGDGFVLLRNVASLAGGAGFILIRRRPAHSDDKGDRLPLGIIAGALLFGVWVLSFPDRLPDMIRDGQFTPTAVAPQSLACVFFFGATARLFLEYRQSRRPEDSLFASLALMFGLAELVFMFSIPWDGRWWFWHGLRLVASLLVLREITRGYVRMIGELRTSLEETSRAEEALRLSLEDRERIAQDLHDGAIQSIYSVTLGLERCQRLLSDRARDVLAPLGAAVADLKTVIRELRGYLVGLEPPISNGRELEAALASLVDSLTDRAQPAYRLEVDPLVVDHVTTEQASHFFAVAREAMSNSVRHSAATNGRLELRLEAGYVRLIVEDDGKGIPSLAPQASGHGLRNMAARARRLHGRLEIVSQPGQGTRIVFDLPRESSHARV